MKTKNELRQDYRDLRAQLTTEEVDERSKQLTQRLAEWLEGQPNWMHFHLYFPIARFKEVNTFYIQRLLEQQGKTIYTSQVNRKENSLATLLLPDNAVFFLDDWEIPVPQESVRVTTSKIQVVFVPLLAYDKSGHRLGFGKGFYDRFLSGMSQEVIKIGLSFFAPEEVIPVEPHDVALDYCITPEKIVKFGRF